MSEIPKIWLTADGLLGDSFRLARAVLESGFRPTHLVGIWRGGAPIGIAVQEFFDVHGLACDHIAIRTASYTGIDQQSKTVKVYALGYLIDTLNADDRLLIIDDVFDSGRSVAAVLAELKARCRANMPAEVRIATVWYKPKRNQTALTPDYFVHESDEWLVFPHEIDGLSEAEIRAHKPAADVILAPIKGLER
ncbi:MAG: hypothetical protein RIS17_1678 [Pseudomonadota bacterium]|jgi:hypoxanthine phosphoribosyltransferase